MSQVRSYCDEPFFSKNTDGRQTSYFFKKDILLAKKINTEEILHLHENYHFCLFFCRNNSARELSAFAESAMAVNRVVLQHMSINMEEAHPEEDKENDEPESNNNTTKTAEKRKAPPPFGLSPPSESKLLQRRTKQSQSLNFSCRVKSGLTKNSNSFVNVADLVSNIVESPGC